MQCSHNYEQIFFPFIIIQQLQGDYQICDT